MITVRLPKSMHESLRTEAHDLRTSMNKLCISKLLQVIGEEMIPNERASSTTASTGSGASAVAGQNTSVPQSTLANRNHQSPSAVSSPYSQQHQQTPPPFKPAQPRF